MIASKYDVTAWDFVDDVRHGHDFSVAAHLLLLNVLFSFSAPSFATSQTESRSLRCCCCCCCFCVNSKGVRERWLFTTQWNQELTHIGNSNDYVTFKSYWKAKIWKIIWSGEVDILILLFEFWLFSWGRALSTPCLPRWQLVKGRRVGLRLWERRFLVQDFELAVSQTAAREKPLVNASDAALIHFHSF